MGQKVNLYTIGQISKICNVTARQLRYYDEKGILQPVTRNENSNYRYYTEKQLEEILLIKELQQIGLSLDEVEILLNNRDLSAMKKELENRMYKAKKEVFDAIRRYEQTVEYYHKVISGISFLQVERSPIATILPTDNISLIDYPEQQIVSTRYNSFCNARTTFLVRRAEIFKIIDQYKLETTGSHMTIYHDHYLTQFKEEEGDVETGIAVKQLNSSCPNFRVFGGFQAVTAMHIGHYRFMEPIYESMVRWAENHGLKLAGPAVEEYLVNAIMTSREENYVTRLYLPLAGRVI